MKSILAILVAILTPSTTLANAEFLATCQVSLTEAANRLEGTERVNGNLRTMLGTISSPFVIPYKRYSGTPHPYSPTQVIDVETLERETARKNQVLQNRKQLLNTELAKISEARGSSLFWEDRGPNSRRTLIRTALIKNLEDKIGAINSEIRVNNNILNDIKTAAPNIRTPGQLLNHLANTNWAKKTTIPQLRDAIEAEIKLYQNRAAIFEGLASKEQSPTKKAQYLAELADRRTRLKSLEAIKAAFGRHHSTISQFPTVASLLTGKMLGGRPAVEVMPEIAQFAIQKALPKTTLLSRTMSGAGISKTRLFKALGVLGVGFALVVGSANEVHAAEVNTEKISDFSRDPRRMLQLVKAGTYTAKEVCDLANGDDVFRYVVDNAVSNVSTFSVIESKGEKNLIASIGSIDFIEDETPRTEAEVKDQGLSN